MIKESGQWSVISGQRKIKENFLKFLFKPSTLTTDHWPLTTLIIFLFLSGCQKNTGDQVCFKEHCFHVEIVSKGEAMRRGLQFRTTLAPDAGMLFVFPSAIKHSFWMKDTLIPLDMIWMDYAHRVVDVRTRVPPCASDPCPVYTPSVISLYVLEINAGVSEKMGLKIGDVFDFNLKNEDGRWKGENGK